MKQQIKKKNITQSGHTLPHEAKQSLPHLSYSHTVTATHCTSYNHIQLHTAQ